MNGDFDSRIFAGALCWLLNHYEVGRGEDEEERQRVVSVIRKLLQDSKITAVDLVKFRQVYLAGRVATPDTEG